MTEAEIAYIAALIDVLGNFTKRRSGHNMLPQVDINTQKIEVLEYLGKVTRTKTFETRRDYMRHGCAEHCAQQHVHIVSRSGRWTVSGAKATIVLAATVPYMRVQQQRAIEAVSLGLQSPWRSHTVNDMQEMGWPLPERLEPPDDDDPS